MRVVVIGAGEVGSNIAASLADSHEVIVLDVDAERVESLTYTYDVLAIEGNGTSLADLEDAGVGEADMLIASTDDDETNLVACSTAKVLGDPFTIGRVRNTNFLRTWNRSEGVFGVDFMVCTNLLTAEEIVQIAGVPAARDVDPFAEGRVQMAEFDVTEDSPIAGQTVREADRFDSLTFAGVFQDDEDVTIPHGDTALEPGSKVVVIGSPESVRSFSETIAPGAHQAAEVVIVGGNAIAAETARLLETQGIQPRLIDHDEERARKLAEELTDTIVMSHDETDVEFLVREHVDKADLAVVTLDVDEQTLLVSLLAKQIGTSRTVSVVEFGEYVDLFEAVGVDIAINPREVVAEEITRFTMDRRAENLSMLESDRAEVIEVEIDGDSVLAGQPISDAIRALPEGVVIGAITRDEQLIVPRGDTVARAGDHVVAFVDTGIVDDVLPRL